MRKRQEYIWCLIALPDGNKEWYCLSKVLRRALFIEKKNNQFWKQTMIGNCWYNRLAIKMALIYWHNKLLQIKLNSIRYAVKKKRLKLERTLKNGRKDFS